MIPGTLNILIDSLVQKENRIKYHLVNVENVKYDKLNNVLDGTIKKLRDLAF